MDRVPNAQIRELYRLKNGVDERIDEGVLQLSSHVERMENDMIAKRVYVGECAGSRLVGRVWKRWIDALRDFKEKEFWMSGKQGQ